MNTIFEGKLLRIESRKIIKLPLAASEPLPSRGMVMAEINIKNNNFILPLEPDGSGSHWFELDDKICEETGITLGDTISVNIQPMDEWAEPEMPEDIITAIANLGLIHQWNDLTTKARWDWLRWIRSTKNPTTRQKRIDVACSKLQKGDRRPCCFDRTRCTLPDVSKSGVLFDVD